MKPAARHAHNKRRATIVRAARRAREEQLLKAVAAAPPVVLRKMRVLEVRFGCVVAAVDAHRVKVYFGRSQTADVVTDLQLIAGRREAR